MIGAGVPFEEAPAIEVAREGSPGEERLGLLKPTIGVFMENRLAVVGVAIVVFFLLFCFVGPLVYHTNQVQTNVTIADRAPSLQHLLGTDDAGYDIVGRLMAGGRTTLIVALAVAVLATSFGVVWGADAGFAGGMVDGAMMRIVDSILSIPTLFLLLFVARIATPSVLLLIIVISGVSWLVPSRLVRSETLALRTSQYVDAARAAGSRPTGIVFRHIIPNVFGTVVVNGTFQVADAVLAIAYLSFLGLGLPPPAANWGAMLSQGVNYVFAGYWWEIWPAGVCIVALVVAFNFIGDGLRDAVEVRLQRR
jgi:peptide/nickel transport system permease protein